MNLKEAISILEQLRIDTMRADDHLLFVEKHLLPLLRSLESQQQECRDLRATFDLRFKADMRAIKRWQAAHPGKELTWPDHADLVCWLLEQIESQQGEDRRLGNAEPTYGPARNEPVVDREAAKQAIKAMSNAELERVLQAATVEFTQAADEDERAAGSGYIYQHRKGDEPLANKVGVASLPPASTEAKPINEANIDIQNNRIRRFDSVDAMLDALEKSANKAVSVPPHPVSESIRVPYEASAVIDAEHQRAFQVRGGSDDWFAMFMTWDDLPEQVAAAETAAREYAEAMNHSGGSLVGYTYVSLQSTINELRAERDRLREQLAAARHVIQDERSLTPSQRDRMLAVLDEQYRGIAKLAERKEGER